MKNSSFVRLIDQDGDAWYDPCFFAAHDADTFLKELTESVPWSQDSIKIFGRTIPQPRLTCWMGDGGASYKYSGLLLEPKIWSPVVSTIKARVEQALAVSFNSALLNYYRDGQDSMGWHRDNEKELGLEPTIASVTFGAARVFAFRTYKTKDRLMKIKLQHGSLLIMSGSLQEFWEHMVPKTGKAMAQHIGARVNITFRRVNV